MGKGFTLIELLVVVLIIGILAAVAVPQYNAAVLRSRMAELMSVNRTLVEAEERFFMANGYYTDDWENLDLAMPVAKDEGAGIKTPNGNTYRIHLNNGVAEGFISGTVSRQIAVTTYFATSSNKAGHTTRCYAIEDDPVGNRTCLAAGGKLTYASAGCILGEGQKNCNIYVMW